MPLDRKKLTDLIQKDFEIDYQEYIDGNDEATSVSPVGDNVVRHVHEEIEIKLEKVIEIQLELVEILISALSAITPPGNGGVGASVLASRSTKLIKDLNKMLVDIKSFKG